MHLNDKIIQHTTEEFIEDLFSVTLYLTVSVLNQGCTNLGHQVAQGDCGA